MRGHWLKALGHAGSPLPDGWLEDGRPERLTRTWFPRRPRIEPGDRLVLYASGWRRIFALCEVLAAPTDAHPHRADPARWPWSVDIETLLAIPRLENAPPVEAAGVMPRAMSQHSHIRLTARQYELAAQAIGSVGG